MGMDIQLLGEGNRSSVEEKTKRCFASKLQIRLPQVLSLMPVLT